MKTVNPHFLHVLLGPLTGLADDDDAVRQFRSLDPNDQISVRQVIRDMLLPHYHEMSVAGREQAKLSLGYYLEKGGVDFGRVFLSTLPPFAPPKNPRDFFLWVWQEFFPGESFAGVVSEGIREVHDIDAPNRMTTDPRGAEPTGSGR